MSKDITCDTSKRILAQEESFGPSTTIFFCDVAFSAHIANGGGNLQNQVHLTKTFQDSATMVVSHSPRFVSFLSLSLSLFLLYDSLFCLVRPGSSFLTLIFSYDPNCAFSVIPISNWNSETNDLVLRHKGFN